MDTLCLELGLRVDETYEQKLAKLRDTIGIFHSWRRKALLSSTPGVK